MYRKAFDDRVSHPVAFLLVLTVVLGGQVTRALVHTPLDALEHRTATSVPSHSWAVKYQVEGTSAPPEGPRPRRAPPCRFVAPDFRGRTPPSPACPARATPRLVPEASAARAGMLTLTDRKVLRTPVLSSASVVRSIFPVIAIIVLQNYILGWNWWVGSEMCNILLACLHTVTQ